MNRGTLYGVGVGPGDPELLTLKAVRILSQTKYIAFPGAVKEETLAYRIVEPVLENLPVMRGLGEYNCEDTSGKTISEKATSEESTSRKDLQGKCTASGSLIGKKVFIPCPVKMTKNRVVLDQQYDEAAKKITDILEQGEDVAFLTIGDPTIYATYMYVHQRVEKAGFKAQIISGIPSFCAAAARLDISISERADMIHVVPASYDLSDALQLPGTKILMKSASKMKEVKEQLIAHGGETYMVENCCLEGERVFRSAEEIDENANYLSLIIVKDQPKSE